MGKGEGLVEGREERARRPVLLGTLLVVLASQISISIVAVDFKISVAIVLLPIFLFLSPGFPLLTVSLLSAPGVFLLRVIFQWVTVGTPAGCWPAHAPEMLFYLIYGVLLSLYFKQIPLLPFRAKKCIPLVAIDAAANFAELLVRLGQAALAPEILLQLLAVGVGRSLLVLAAIRALDYYGFQVLHREDAERYQRLLMMTASLKSEVAWMDKGTDLIENTMNSAYHLYSQLRSQGAHPDTVNTALTIAKDIHEVKKEYFLIMRGISEALDAEEGREGMTLSELFSILGQSVERLAREQGKSVAFASHYEEDLYTKRHYYLMSIFRNLLNNAVEAAGTGRMVHISLTQQSQGTEVVFQISDDCGGIPPERMGQIFAPGFSSKINYTTGAVNRGLGLCIVKDLTEEELGGTVEVASAGGGTVFTLRIPRTGLEGTGDAVLSD